MDNQNPLTNMMRKNNPDVSPHAISAPSQAIRTHLDGVVTCLNEGEVWHRRAATECRRFYVRGWGQWHDKEAMCDAECNGKLVKIIGDIPTLRYSPNSDLEIIGEAYNYQFQNTTDPEEFKRIFAQHHEAWIEREERCIAHLMSAIKMANEFNTELYSDLLCLKKEIESEIFRVDVVKGHMWLTNWGDIGYISQVLHEYFENEYKGGPIDFNIG